MANLLSYDTFTQSFIFFLLHFLVLICLLKFMTVDSQHVETSKMISCFQAAAASFAYFSVVLVLLKFNIHLKDVKLKLLSYRRMGILRIRITQSILERSKFMHT